MRFAAFFNFKNRIYDMENNNTRKEADTLTMASYGTGKFLAEFFTGAYGLMVYYYFETEMHLSGFFVSIATIIYAFWNAINDPLIGYATGKKGKRSRWVIMGLILCAATYCIIFTPFGAMKKSPYLLFLWMVITVCLFDYFYSLWEVNYQGIFPDKFRSTKEREKCAIICTVIGVFGIALGSVLPPLFYTYGQPDTFKMSALIVAIIGLVCTVLIKRGVKETKEMLDSHEKRSASDAPSFYQSLKNSMKHKEFTAFVLLLFFYQSACICMTTSVNYVAHGYLGFDKGSATTPIFAAMLVGTLISVIIWKKVSAKIQNNNQKMLVITGLFMAIASILMVLAETQIHFAIGMFIWGMGFGGFWTFMIPGMADVVDSVVVKEKIRNDGILMGVRAFFARLSYASQAIVFWLCHKFFGYDSTIHGMQSTAAKFGIKMHFCIIPCIFFLLSVIIFLKLNPLTPALVKENKKALKELGL